MKSVSREIALYVNLAVAMAWLSLTSPREYLSSMNLTRYSIFEYLSATWQSSTWAFLSILISLLLFIFILILFIWRFINYLSFLIGVVILFLSALIASICVSMYAFVPVFSISLLPLGFCAYQAKKIMEEIGSK
jgi:hypothetical protein